MQPTQTPQTNTPAIDLVKLHEYCKDPVTEELVDSPRITSCGHNYDKKTIEAKHLEDKLYFSCDVCEYIDLWEKTKIYKNRTQKDISEIFRNVSKRTVEEAIQDPVSLDHIKTLCVTPCEHGFDKDTLIKVSFKKETDLNVAFTKCPVCNNEFPSKLAKIDLEYRIR